VTYYNTTNPGALLNYVRLGATGTGTMTLDLSNNHDLNTGDFSVGNGGQGAVTQSAGLVNTATFSVGKNTTRLCTYTITGGTLSCSDNQYIGMWGLGEIQIRNEGQVFGSYAYLGWGSDGRGTAFVEGPGAKWTTSQTMNVGTYGFGELTITNGGQVECRGGSSAKRPAPMARSLWMDKAPS
jgi:T5SS/PEP-CTERM-associated repeat protein